MIYNRSERSLIAEMRFKARLIELGAELREPEWLGTAIKHKVTCGSGHTCYVKPNNVLSGQGICNKCSSHRANLNKSNSITARDKFSMRLAELGATLIDTQWRGVMRQYEVICIGGHKCNPSPMNVNNGHGICLSCIGRSPIIAEANFRECLTGLGAVLLESEWLGARTPHKVRCIAGHECNPLPNSTQQGRGICIQCVNAWDIFYIVINRKNKRVKFGITSRSSNPRLKRHAAAGYTEIERLISNVPAYELERIIKIALAACNYVPARGREYFDIDALPFILYIVDTYMTHGCAPWQLTEVKAE